MQNGKIHKINENMNCNSKFVIYLLICKCKKTYIGHTNNFRLHMNNQKDHTKHSERSKLFVNKHLFNCGKKWTVMPIFQMNTNDLISRLCKEMKFIDMYEPSLNVNS